MSAETLEALRNWLMRQPRPALIRVHTAEGPEDFRVDGTPSWRALAETIWALQPELLQAMGDDGHIIRARRWGEEPARDNGSPSIPEALSRDPETARLTHFADLLHRAYQHSTEVAFAKMVELFERNDTRFEAMERRVERAERDRIRDLEEQLAEAQEKLEEQQEAGSPGEQIMSAFAQGMGAADATRPNGKGHA